MKRKNQRKCEFCIALIGASATNTNMIATQMRENVTVSVNPAVTAKAASIAANAGNKTTANVLEEWLEKVAESLPDIDLVSLRGKGGSR